MNSLPPIPGSPFGLDHLLGFVFLLHLIFMNFVVAAPLVISWYLLARGEDGRPRATWLSGALPGAFTFTINFGVAPLLFVQAIYTKQFYTANTLLGTRWLSIVLLLLLAFYGAYLLKNRLSNPNKSVRLSGLLALIIAALVWAIGVLMVGNYLVSTSESQWSAYRADPTSFMNAATFLPRSLHFLTGSFAVTGLWMVWIAWWKSRREWTPTLEKFRHQGLILATAATGLQIVIGVWFLLRLPNEAWDKLFSGSFVSLVWMSAVAAGLILLGFLIVASLFPARMLWQRISTTLMLLTLFGMIAGRDLIRITSFGKDFNLRQLPSITQSSPMQVFFVVLLAGILVIAYLIRLMWRLPRDHHE